MTPPALPDDSFFPPQDTDLLVPEHECNDCGVMIPDHLPICAKCERWYEEEA